VAWLGERAGGAALNLAELLAGSVERAARGLLGCRLSAGGVTVRLTEVEAYSGTGLDPASHAHRGLTARKEIMFGLAVVGASAGAASFTHIHDRTLHNSQGGTSTLFGWANAGISELVPVAALITIRQNRQAGKSIVFPLALLIAASALSPAAQLAVAKPVPSGGCSPRRPPWPSWAWSRWC
jgi:hypothetical protein